MADLILASVCKATSAHEGASGRWHRSVVDLISLAPPHPTREQCMTPRVVTAAVFFPSPLETGPLFLRGHPAVISLTLKLNETIDH